MRVREQKGGWRWAPLAAFTSKLVSAEPRNGNGKYIMNTIEGTGTKPANVVVRGNASGFLQEIVSGAHQLRADEPVAVGGSDAAPGPYDYWYPYGYGYGYYAPDYYPYDYDPGVYQGGDADYYAEGAYDLSGQYADSTVTAVQQQLARQGYYRGEIDGIFGAETRRAVVRYQSDQGLRVTGNLNADTLRALGLQRVASN